MVDRLLKIFLSAITAMLAALVCLPAGFAAEPAMFDKIKISDLYFFGYDGLDLQKIKPAIQAAMGTQKDVVDWFEYRQKIAHAVREVTGKEASDEALVFFDKRYIVFVGLPGKSNNLERTYLPVPEKRLAVPETIRELYEKLMEANVQQLTTGNQLDRERYFQRQEQLKLSAQKVPDLLMHSLEASSDSMDRAVAANAIGLIATDKIRLDALVKAAQDSNPTVRNNATRALGVILIDRPQLANQIAPAYFIEMLNSPEWSDRNKGIFVLEGITKTKRDPQLLHQLRVNTLSSLKEMCLWPEAYADGALLMIGRIAGIPDDKLEFMIREKQTSEIINSLDAR